MNVLDTMINATQTLQKGEYIMNNTVFFCNGQKKSSYEVLPDFQEIEHWIKETKEKLPLKLTCFAMYEKDVLETDNFSDTRISKLINLSTFKNEKYITSKEFSLNNYKSAILTFVNQIYEIYKDYKFEYDHTEKKMIDIVEFSPIATGYFFHEILGHSFEIDHLSRNKRITQLEIPKWLCFHDLADRNDLIGVGNFDDCGKKLKNRIIIQNGEISKKIMKNYGILRSQNFGKRPIPRMRTTRVFTNRQFRKSIPKVVVEKINGGYINPDTLEIMINGDGFYYSDKKYLAKKITINTNLNSILQQASYLGENIEFSSGFCIKKNQTIRVGMEAPTSQFKNLEVEFEIYR
jgi:hypothetical protein